MANETGASLVSRVIDTVQNWGSNSEKNTKRPTLALKFRNSEITALVDTGAQITCMSERMFAQMPRTAVVQRLDNGRGLPVKDASGREMNVTGVYAMQLQVHGLGLVLWPFVVFQTLNSDCIIGDDFLRAHGALLDRRNGQISWKRQEHTRKLVLRQSCWIQPHTHARIFPELLDKQVQQVGIVSSKVLTCVESVENVVDDRVGVLMYNETDEPMLLRAGTYVADFEELAAFETYSIAEIAESTRRGCPGRQRPTLTKEKENFIRTKVNLRCPQEWREKYVQLLLELHEAVAGNDFDIGECDLITHKVRLKNQEPIHTKQYRIPFAHQEFLEKTVDGLVKRGVVEASKSPYNSPVFCVKKPHSDKLRLVQDLRKVNEAAYEDKYAFREVSDCMDAVGNRNSNVFTSLDFLNGYWQQVLDEGSRECTAFTVPGKGRFQWKRTVMGLAGAPASFSRLMEEVFRGVEGVITYLDDCLTHSNGHEKHLQDVRECLQRCIKYNLKLNLQKCTFGAREVPYLGYTLSGEGVKPGKEKTEAVAKFPPPKSIQEVRQFNGLTNYFRHLIPDYARLSAQLSGLTKQSTRWKGGQLPDAAREAFEELKRRLCEEPLLAHPRRDRPFILATDAAGGSETKPGGFGAVLTQKYGKEERVVAYASRSLKDNEKNYSAFLLEMAAVCWAIEHFHVYLYDTNFTVITDHKPMEKLGVVHKKTLLRLQELMARYTFQLRYRPGKENGPADALSRNPLQVMQVTTMQWQEHQFKDTFCREMLQAITTGEQVKSTTMGQKHFNSAKAYVTRKEGVIWFRDKDKVEKLIVPAIDRWHLLQAAHTSRFAGHGGEQKTLDRLKARYWWPYMSVDVKNFVAGCMICQEAKPGNTKRGVTPLKPLPIPTGPNWRVHLDLFGPLKKSNNGNKYIMVMTDAFTKLTEMAALPNKEAKTVAMAFFSQWVCRYSVPRRIVTDGGGEFVNQIHEVLLRLLEVEHSITSAYHPQTNSSAESFNREIIRYLQTRLNDADDDWEAWLPVIMLAYNTRIHRATQESPFFLTYAHEPTMPHFILEDRRPLYGEDWGQEAVARMKKAYADARLNMEKQQKQMQQQYNKRAKQQETFQVGETVMVFFPKSNFHKQNHKFVRPWVKCVVTQKGSNETYEVKK